jgi:AbrB family looped-hinge helix DNA binding protein
MEAKTDTVKFTVKGQIVIPSWVRKQFGIKEGTKAVLRVVNEGIVLRPITKETVAKLQGSLKVAGTPN